MYQQPKKHLAERGIELKEVYKDDEISFELSGSRISSPQRYQLLSLLVLIFTLVYPNLLLFVLGLSLAFWSSRRFKLIISSARGVELHLIVLFPYRQLRLPLIDTQIKQFQEKEPVAQSLQANSDHLSSTQLNHLTFVSLVLSHPSLHGEPLTLLKLDQESGQVFSRVFASCLKLAYQKRNLSSKTPLALFKHEPGEWVIALIDLFPKYLAPKSNSQFNRTKVTWWSVSNTHLYLSISAIIVCCILIIFQATLSISLLLGITITLVFSRESFLIEPDEITWRKSLLGIPLRELRFSKMVHTKLEEDIHAPSGRHILIYDPVNPLNTLVIGQAWDAAWIHKELSAGLRLCKTSHLPNVLR